MAWVQETAVDYPATPGRGMVADGAAILLFDRQINVRPGGDDRYSRMVSKVLTAAAVEERSQLDISVDPNYQTLDLHRLQVVRAGRAIDLSATARITVLPEETDLVRRIYNGRNNVNILIPDVRIGDVVEYAYTVHSSSRVFPGHFSAQLQLGWAVPVHDERVRIQYPADRRLSFQRSDGEAPPQARPSAGHMEVVFNRQNVPAYTFESDVPAWHRSTPQLQVSDLDSWSQVQRSMGRLFEVDRTVGPLTRALVDEIRSQGGPIEAQALRALRFAQEQIRYTSISVGPGTHVPVSPETVMKQRYGDCKDKALLLATLLNALGIDAHPALVNSEDGHTLSGALPSPYAFDHAIVKVSIAGETYWLDATAAPQYSPLSIDDPADFEQALVLEDGSEGLEPIPRPASGVARREISEEFDLTAGQGSPARLKIVTRLMGRAADRSRSRWSEGNMEQIQADYLNYIARYYPSAKVAAPLAVEDEEQANLITVTEQYIVEHPFSTNPNSGREEFTVHADMLHSYADAVGTGRRSAPLAVPYPVQIRQRIVAMLPGEWQIAPQKVTVENPAFRYESSIDYSNQIFEAIYDFETTGDAVPAAEVPRYLADRKRMNDDLDFTFFSTAASAGSSPPSTISLSIFAALFTLVLGSWFCLGWLYKWR